MSYDEALASKYREMWVRGLTTNSILLNAARRGYSLTAQFAIEFGATNLNQALITAYINHKFDLVRLLLSHGGDINLCPSLPLSDLLELYEQGVRDFGIHQPIIDAYQDEME